MRLSPNSSGRVIAGKLRNALRLHRGIISSSTYPVQILELFLGSAESSFFDSADRVSPQAFSLAPPHYTLYRAPFVSATLVAPSGIQITERMKKSEWPKCISDYEKHQVDPPKSCSTQMTRGLPNQML